MLKKTLLIGGIYLSFYFLLCTPVGSIKVRKPDTKKNQIKNDWEKKCQIYYDSKKGNKPSDLECEECWCIDTSNIRRLQL